MCAFNMLLLPHRSILNSHSRASSFSAIPHNNFIPTQQSFFFLISFLCSKIYFEWWREYLIKMTFQSLSHQKGMFFKITCKHNLLAHYQCPLRDFQYNNSLPLMLITNFVCMKFNLFKFLDALFNPWF